MSEWLKQVLPTNLSVFAAGPAEDPIDIIHDLERASRKAAFLTIARRTAVTGLLSHRVSRHYSFPL
ncbi:hypothetical protein KCP74_06815 [Salmonella enterica subsp. enterica]|nr:hypothetical protein KCP74_06815 [Salmonella enterica subsp. enterica]